MYFETDRLRREAILEGFMPTETIRCSRCDRVIVIVAKEGDEKPVECKCGHKMIVVIEKAAA
jgi:DNA-directed RNA polymerase subunit RPC12/RpoP